MGVEAASEAELCAVASKLHAQLPGGGWFKLFRHMDDDGSGKVTFAEFEDLVRHELQLPPRELPEARLKAVWVALDDDGSGYISAGEFGAFMRKGEALHAPHISWRERVEAQKRAAGDAVRAESAQLLNRSLQEAAAVGGLVASDEEVRGCASS